ncbi:MAG: LysM peptidoglycan-binding domain-containing protein [Anaerolineae bacterium]
MARLRGLWVLAAVVILGAFISVPVVADEGALYHTVVYGDTLYSIARKYSVTVAALVDANGIADPDLIYTGQRLLIPETTGEQVTIHVVAPGESLLSIAAKYGLSILDIAERNNIMNVNLIFVGQRLVIPTEGEAPPETDGTEDGDEVGDETEMPAVQEAIIISQPLASQDVTSPVTVTGWGSGFENTLAVDILDQFGTVIGQGYVIIDAEFGQVGPFSGVIEFTPPDEEQFGRIQVYGISPRDGAIEHLASVTVNLLP